MRSHAAEHRPAHRVVRAAHRVEPRVLELLDPALVGACDGGAAEDAVVVVDARAPQVDGFAVDAQTALRVDGDGADPELGRRPVELAVAVAVVVGDDDRAARVPRRLVDAPPPRLSQEQALAQRLGPTGEHRQRRDVACDDGAGVVGDLGRHRRRHREPGVVLDDRGDRDHRAVVVDLRSGHVHAVERDVHGFADHEVHVAVDPRARVPARIPVRSGLDRDRVVGAVPEVLTDRHREVRVAVGAVPDERAVHRHPGPPVHALELDQDLLPAVGLRRGEGLLVLPHTAGEVAVGGFPRRIPGRPDHGVVGQLHRHPRLPAAAHQLREGVHLRADAPVVVERGADHGCAPDSGKAWRRAARYASRTAVASTEGSGSTTSGSDGAHSSDTAADLAVRRARRRPGRTRRARRTRPPEGPRPSVAGDRRSAAGRRPIAHRRRRRPGGRGGSARPRVPPRRVLRAGGTPRPRTLRARAARARWPIAARSGCRSRRAGWVCARRRDRGAAPRRPRPPGTRARATRSPPRARPSRCAIASVTFVAFSVHARGRNRPVASANPATAPDASLVGCPATANTVPDVPSEIATSPSVRPSPSAAAMLSPVPTPTTASTEGARGGAGREHGRCDGGIEADEREGVRHVGVEVGRPVAGPGRVAAVGAELAGELHRQPVVGQEDVGERREVLGLVLSQPGELGDGERSDRHGADDVGPALRSPALHQRRRLRRRLGVVPELRRTEDPTAGVEHDHAVLLTGDADRGDAVPVLVEERRRPRPTTRAGPARSAAVSSADAGGGRTGRARRCRRRAPRACTTGWRSRLPRRASPADLGGGHARFEREEHRSGHRRVALDAARHHRYLFGLERVLRERAAQRFEQELEGGGRLHRRRRRARG